VKKILLGVVFFLFVDVYSEDFSIFINDNFNIQKKIEKYNMLYKETIQNPFRKDKQKTTEEHFYIYNKSENRFLYYKTHKKLNFMMHKKGYLYIMNTGKRFTKLSFEKQKEELVIDRYDYQDNINMPNHPFLQPFSFLFFPQNDSEIQGKDYDIMSKKRKSFAYFTNSLKEFKDRCNSVITKKEVINNNVVLTMPYTTLGDKIIDNKFEVLQGDGECKITIKYIKEFDKNLIVKLSCKDKISQITSTWNYNYKKIKNIIVPIKTIIFMSRNNSSKLVREMEITQISVDNPTADDLFAIDYNIPNIIIDRDKKASINKP